MPNPTSPTGFSNGVLSAWNADFSGSTNPALANGLVLDNQIWLGSTLVNANNTHINVKTLTAGTGVTFTPSAGALTISLTGGGAAIETIAGDSGSISGNAVTIFANNATLNAGSSVSFVNSGTVSTLNVTDANQNTIIGQGAGKAGITSTFNTVLGYQAGAAITSGMGANVLIGWKAGIALTTGDNNQAYGQSALFAATTASHNIALGGLGNLLTGQYNISIGNSGTAYTGAESSNILINNIGVLGESNVIRIGQQGSGLGQQNVTFIAGIAGITNTNNTLVTQNSSTGQLGATTSTYPNTAGTSGGVLTSDGTNFISSNPIGVSGLQYVKMTLTSQQIKALHGTPQQLIAAQGAGKVIVVVNTWTKMTYGGSNVFVAGAAQFINYSYSTGTVINQGATTAMIVASASNYISQLNVAIGLTAIANLENVAVNVFNGVATEISGNAANDNTMTFSALYYVISL